MKGQTFLILLLAILTMGVMIAAKDPGQEQIMVTIGEGDSKLQLPIEEYMLGVMAAVADPEYDSECLKALAILIRGNLERKREEGEELIGEEPYFDFAARRRIYGENQQLYETRMLEAIEATSGLVAVSENRILEGHYHALSAGVTKASEDGKSVICEKSMEAADFFLRKEVEKEEVGEVSVLKKDPAGYIEEITLKGNVVSGEYFREYLFLPSFNLDIEEREETYFITARGKGHGMGMDLYYANELAKQGLGYHEILEYFFKDFILKKIIV